MSIRKELNFNRNWKFIRDDIENAFEINFDDSEWYNVGLPHDFSMPYFMETTHYSGYGWYRKNFEISNSDKRFFVEFDGVFQVAKVYINGEFVGEHRGGYTGFSFDITDKVQLGNNIIAIQVDNLWRADLAPRSGDHQFSGGIYRDVYLVATNDVHVSWYGTFVQTTQNNMTVQTEIDNCSLSSKNVCLKHSVVDMDNKEVASFVSESVKVDKKHTFSNKSDDIDGLILWSVSNPYLYKLVTTVFVDETKVDEYITTFGFRTTKWTHDKGFFLNDEHIFLDGANAHQDHAGWANAVTNKGFARDIAMLKEAGLNFIRGSHYPHDVSYADECDKQGMLFWSECVFWGGGGCQGKESEPSKTSEDWRFDTYPTKEKDQAGFDNSCMIALEEMIRINRNHPSIITWSMGNEVFFTSNVEKAKELVIKMAKSAKELDPSRYVSMGGVQREGFDKLDGVEIAGYNGDGATIETYQNPGVPNIVAEYGSHTSQRGLESDMFRPYYCDTQVENDIYNYTKYSWRSGIALWCAFHHGTILGKNLAQMGFVDYYRLPLKAWYWYRENRTAVAPEFSKNGTATKLLISASQTSIKNDGTEDAHIIATVVDDNGVWINTELTVTLEIVEGVGIFPTGKKIELTANDGKCAIEFRSYYAGETKIKASANGLEAGHIFIKTLGDESEVEPDVALMYGAFMSGKKDSIGAIKKEKEWINFSASPCFASSNNEERLLAVDGNLLTLWKAKFPGSGQWWLLDNEREISIYDYIIESDNEGYKFEIATAKEGPWTAIKEKPNGIRARYFKISFIAVHNDKFAQLSQFRILGIDGEE